MYYGGYAAEEEFFGEADSGCNHDMKYAVGAAETIVMRGLSKNLESVHYGTLLESRPGDQALAAKVNQEVIALLKEGYAEARRVVAARRKEIEMLADALERKPTLTPDEVYEIVGYDPDTKKFKNPPAVLQPSRPPDLETPKNIFPDDFQFH